MAGKIRLGKNVKSIKQNSGVFPVALRVLVLPVIDAFFGRGKRSRIVKKSKKRNRKKIMKIVATESEMVD